MIEANPLVRSLQASNWKRAGSKESLRHHTDEYTGQEFINQLGLDSEMPVGAAGETDVQRNMGGGEPNSDEATCRFI